MKERRESKLTDVLDYSGGTFNGSNHDTGKNSKCELTGVLTHLNGLRQMSLTLTDS